MVEKLRGEVEAIVDLLYEYVAPNITNSLDKRRVLIAGTILKRISEHYQETSEITLMKLIRSRLRKSMGESLREVILLLLREKGGKAHRRELAVEIRNLFPKFAGRKVSEVSIILSNALTSLAANGLIKNTARGVWALTPEGRRKSEELKWEKVIETLSPELLEPVS